MILGAVLIRKENESNAQTWLKSIRTAANNLQPSSLHFRSLKDGQKEMACREMAKLSMRAFVVISNKQNMRGHKNQSAAYISGHRHWFYMWMTRLLLERVTDFCAETNKKEGTPNKKLQIEFSRRKDLKKNHFTDYFTRIWAQGEDAFLAKRTIDWSVFDFERIYFFDHETRAGLQFADIATSAFYQAVNIHPHGKCYPDYATSLRPIIHKKNKLYLNEGFTVFPFTLKNAKITNAQKEVFKFYGLPNSRM